MNPITRWLFPRKIPASTFRCLNGATLQIEPTHDGDRALLLAATDTADKPVRLQLQPRSVRNLIGELTRHADLIDPPKETP
jgi:hypothetical protein